jgi:hypothetical protein
METQLKYGNQIRKKVAASQDLGKGGNGQWPEIREIRRQAMSEQFFADYLERLEDRQRRLHHELQDLSAEAMDWSPGRP